MPNGGTMSKWYFVPKDWTMSDDLLEWTLKKGLSQAQIDDELESFRDHQYRRPMMRVDACWRNWVKNAIKWGNVTPTVQKEYRQPQELSDEQRVTDMQKWRDDMKRLGVK